MVSKWMDCGRVGELFDLTEWMIMSGFPGRLSSTIFAHSVFPDGLNSMIMAVAMFSPSVPRTRGTGFSVNNNMTWLVRKGTLSTPSVTYNYRPPDFSWQHIALSWSGHFGNSNLRIYHNGQLVSDATKVGGGGNRVSDASNMFTLGNRPQGNSSYFKGWMDDFVSETRDYSF